jgi:hypothetical protein
LTGILCAAAIIAAIAAVLYASHRLYWFTVRQKARNVGIFRDDRRENDWR